MTFLFLTVPFSSGPGLSILSSCSRNFAEIKVFLLSTSFPFEQDFLANVVITQKLYKLGVFWRLQGILWSLFGVWQYSRSVGTEPMVFLQLFEAPFPSLDTLQPINVPLARRGPKLPPGFGGGSLSCFPIPFQREFQAGILQLFEVVRVVLKSSKSEMC